MTPKKFKKLLKKLPWNNYTCDQLQQFKRFGIAIEFTANKRMQEIILKKRQAERIKQIRAELGEDQ